MRFVNLTPHEVRMIRGDGTEVSIPPSGAITRVGSTSGPRVDTVDGVPVYAAPAWGEVEGLPPADGESVFIVSSLVAARVHRYDVVSPGTGPEDGAVRDEAGRVVAVTRLNAAAAATSDPCIYCMGDNGPVGVSGRGVRRENVWDCAYCGGN